MSKEYTIEISIFQFHVNFVSFSDSTLTNDLVVTAPTNQVLDHHHGEGLLQLEPPLTSSEYSFTLDEQDNLNDLFDNLPF